MTQQVSAEGEAYHNFIKYMTNPYTSINYISRLKVFLKYCQTDNADNLFFNGNINMIQTRICDFLVHAQSQGFSSATITGYLTTIKFFYEMNDVTSLNWKKIARIKNRFGAKQTIGLTQPLKLLNCQVICKIYEKKTHSDVSPDLGDATQRWDWISNSMLPKYKQLETQNPAKVGLDMTKYAADLLNICSQ